MLSSKNRFHGHGSLRYVYKNGQVVRGRLITLKYSENSHRTTPRVSVVISKKVLKSAVGRNRIRRRVYETVRLEMSKLSPSQDMVFLVFSSEVLAVTSEELTATIRQLISSAGIYKNKP